MKFPRNIIIGGRVLRYKNVTWLKRYLAFEYFVRWNVLNRALASAFIVKTSKFTLRASTDSCHECIPAHYGAIVLYNLHWRARSYHLQIEACKTSDVSLDTDNIGNVYFHIFVRVPDKQWEAANWFLVALLRRVFYVEMMVERKFTMFVCSDEEFISRIHEDFDRWPGTIIYWK